MNFAPQRFRVIALHSPLRAEAAAQNCVLTMRNAAGDASHLLTREYTLRDQSFRPDVDGMSVKSGAEGGYHFLSLWHCPLAPGALNEFVNGKFRGLYVSSDPVHPPQVSYKEYNQNITSNRDGLKFTNRRTMRKPKMKFKSSLL